MKYLIARLDVAVRYCTRLCRCLTDYWIIGGILRRFEDFEKVMFSVSQNYNSNKLLIPVFSMPLRSKLYLI